MKTKSVRIKTTVKPCRNGHVHIRSTVSNGHTTKTVSKTVKAK